MSLRSTLSAGLMLLALLTASNPAQARIDVEAYPGAPFGVGRITLHRADLRGPVDTNRIRIEERDGRVLYPAVRVGRLGPILSGLLGTGDGGTDHVTVTFLFRGEGPLQLNVYLPDLVRVDALPSAPKRREGERLREQWWKDYHADLRSQREAGDYPPWIHTYLSSMLGTRMNLETPLLSRNLETQPSQSQEILELLLGLERLREATLRETVRGGGDFGQAADLPLPPEPAWPPLNPPYDAAVKTESIASHVPRECFYVRFGRFSNFLWLNNLLDENGGELGRLVTLRGFNQTAGNRLEEQLSLKKDVLGDLFGESIIADVALIGRDTFLDEGGAMGLLFQAKNNRVLADDFVKKRRLVFEQEKKNGCTLETLKIAGHEVTLLSTPDNRIRSFYAADGEYHLVTTSRAIAERFLVCTDAKETIADLPEFLHARTVMPLERNDTIFAYFSTWFLRGLTSPHYQTELRRRMKSVTDLEALQLARLAARGENAPHATIEDLIAGGFLPRGFGRRPDGSGPIVADNVMLDSLRGARGSFLPIPDVAIRGVTAEEAARCAAQAEFYAANWKQLDPLFLGLRRFKRNETGLERLVLDAHVSPLEESKYGWVTSMLGPPVRNRITSAPGDVVHVQAFLKGGMFDSGIAPHHMFLGVQDHLPLQSGLPAGGIFQTLQLLKSTPGYLGSWPKSGLVDRLPLGLGGGPPDINGYSQLPLGLWRRQGEGFSVLSFDPQLLANVTPHLGVEQAGDEAQIRVRIDDLSATRLATLVNSLNYDRARQTSMGNARLLNTLSQQLHVPPAEAKGEAERLLDAQLVCTLGGEYRLAKHASGLDSWASTAWATADPSVVPAGYQAPLLAWFRGTNVSVTKLEDRLFLHAELDMQRAKGELPQFELPQFDFGLFGGKKKAEEPAEPAKKLFPDTLPPPKVEKKPGQGKEF